jgi:hypothetical protein
VFLVEGTRRADYKPLRHPVSSLALGPRGWVQVVNFAVAGTLYLAAARGLSRTPDPLLGSRLGPTLFAATGVGLLGSAAFSTDPVSGYPPGTADLPTKQTTRMKAHGIAAMPIFLGIPAAAFLYARGGSIDPLSQRGRFTPRLPACPSLPPLASPAQVSIKHQRSSTSPGCSNAPRS